MMAAASRALRTVVLVAVVPLFFSTPAPVLAQPTAMDRPVVDAIAVEGNVRVEAEAVRREIRLVEGAEITLRALGRDVRAVFGLGYFSDVQVRADEGERGVILTFVVTEKPAIGAVEYSGANKLGEDDFAEVVDLRVGAILDEGAVRRAAGAIEDLYREKGYFLVEVDHAIVPLDDTRVTVAFEIREFTKVRVASVTLLGNRAFEDREILRYLQTRPGGVLSFLNGTGKFDLENLRNDLQTIRAYYYDNGYLDVGVEDPVVEISRERTNVFVTLRIDEGDQYTVSTVSVSGDLLESQEKTMELVDLEPSEVFSTSSIREDIEAIQRRYRDMGYAFANVNVLTDIDPDADTIGVTYDLQRGEMAYIGRIRIVGNAATRDRVIRRELVIAEGDRYSLTAIDRSKAYLRQLGIFEEVTVRERPSPEGPNLIDLEIEVSERHTRSFQIGAGFSSAENFLATAQISENNLLGRGQSLSLNAMFSSIRQLFMVSFVEPHLWDSPVSMQIDVFNRSLAYRNFDRLSRGGSLNLGYRPFLEHPFWRALSFFGGYRVEDVQLRNVSSTRSLRLYQSGLTSSITTGVSLDRRNDRITTTRGVYVAVNNELADALWGSDFEFDRVRGIVRGYTNPRWLNCAERGELRTGQSKFTQGACRWVRGWVLRGNFEIGYVGSTRADAVVPASERFYPGGPNSVRGFPQFSLGPRVPAVRSGGNPASTLTDVFDGGTRELLANVELEFPLVNAIGIRGVVFADAGNAFGVSDPYSFRLDVFGDRDDELVLRTAVGLGFRWQSPLGMLRFEWGFPLQVRDSERRTVFNFSIGPSF